MTLDHESFERVRRLLYKHAAIVLEAGKEYLVESRLSALWRAHGFADINALCRRLDARHPSLVAEVVDAMTINETSFFRDHHPFEALRSVALPDLLEQRADVRTLRIWCAACSTGQEPYSLAMLLDQHFPRLATWNVSILATDLSSAVLARAASGRYRQLEVDRGLPDGALARYFHQQGADWVIRPELRKLVRFRPLNLAESWPALPRFDLVMLRNVLIYFDQVTKRTVLEKIRQHVTEDGYLVLGGSETTPPETRGFKRVPVPRASLYQPASSEAR
jgi:chemotaxis protein methyltransferase CheR